MPGCIWQRFYLGKCFVTLVNLKKFMKINGRMHLKNKEMKKIVLLLMVSIVSLQLSAQDTTTLYINKIKRSTCIVNPEQTSATLLLEKKLLSSIKVISIQVQSKWNSNKIYTRRLEVESDTSVFVAELKGKAGFYNILNTGIKKKLQAGKTVNLYLILNPSNPMMKIASRRIYLGTFAVK